MTTTTMPPALSASATKSVDRLSQRDLQDLLTEMTRFGRPTITMTSGNMGWYCRVEMNTNTAGTSFDVASDFKHTTATDAALQCLERIRTAVKTIGGAA